MPRYDFDLVTIGAGSGGVAATRRAANYGARAAIIESLRIGGTCVLRGCVPKKLLVYASEFKHAIEDAAGFGWHIGEATLDWAALITAKNRELDRLNRIYIGLLQTANVEMIDGFARFIDPHTIAVSAPGGGELILTAERILIATGGWPMKPDIPGVDSAITSNEALDLMELPQKIVIVGGGYIAIEFAGVFNSAGVAVELVIRDKLPLRGFDEEIRFHLAQSLIEAGVKIHAGQHIDEITRENGRLRSRLKTGEILTSDQVMMATGRAPNTAKLGLSNAGVAIDLLGAIPVDDYSQTNVPHIYAVGDVTNRMNLTPVATSEGRAFAETVYHNNPMKMDFANVPTAVFSQPAISTVGLTEAAAEAQFHDIEVYVQHFRPLRHALSGRNERVFMKLIVDAASQRVIGAHMFGTEAAEIIQGIAIAIKCGATKAQFDQTIGIHPTIAEEFVTMRQKRDKMPPLDPLALTAANAALR